MVPDEVSAGGPTVAVRSPAHAVARALIQSTGTPIAAPSANLFSHTSPTTAQHVWDDLHSRIDLILDGGPTTIGLESTVIDLTGVRPLILRPGGISQEALSEVLGDVALRTSRTVDETLASPGMLDRHYAPQTPFMLLTGDEAAARRGLFAAIQEQAELGRMTAVLAFDEDLAELRQLNCLVSPLGSMREPDAVAVRLYAALRAADNLGADVLLARDLPAHGIGLAIRDRLRRAARTVVTVT
jgi:L-threonylcarbamoyladenylate synthase